MAQLLQRKNWCGDTLFLFTGWKGTNLYIFENRFLPGFGLFEVSSTCESLLEKDFSQRGDLSSQVARISAPKDSIRLETKEKLIRGNSIRTKKHLF